VLDLARVRKYETGVEVRAKGDYYEQLTILLEGQLVITEPGKESRYMNRGEAVGGVIRKGEEPMNVEVFANEYSRVIHIEMYSLYGLMSIYTELKDAITLNSMEINQNEMILR
jgi:hypothetical protein